MPIDLAAGAALCATLPAPPITANHRYIVAPAGDVAQCVVDADAAGIAWLATHRDELIRLAAVGLEHERGLSEARQHHNAKCTACGHPRHSHDGMRHVFVETTP